ncbi:MAG: PD40 domain-containing protein [Candidatus Woesebacteria bacterium]|nr:MAG: PD40 domain-containing protein [Candidatus Woesebacteria bacterium]
MKIVVYLIVFVLVMSIITNNQTKTEAKEEPSVQNLQWSPDGKQVVFVEDLDKGNQAIMIANSDGTNIWQLTFVNAATIIDCVLWSYDSKYLLVGTSGGSGIDLKLFELSSKKTKDIEALLKPLKMSFASWSTPSWSPDSKQITFGGRVKDGEVHLLILDINSDNLRDLTNEFNLPLDLEEINPDWSKDGKQLLFILSHYSHIDYATHARLYLANIDGSGLKAIWPADGESNHSISYAKWSPDNKLILIQGSHEETENKIIPPGMPDVFILDVETLKLKTIKPDSKPWPKLNATWSPDGTKIAFMDLIPYPVNYGVDTDFFIYVLAIHDDNFSFEEAIQIASPVNSNHYAWSPDGKQITYDLGISGGDNTHFSIYVVNVDGSYTHTFHFDWKD